jgi:transposase
VGIDERSWKRRQRYLTVFMDLESKRWVFVSPTRQKDTLKGFLDFLRTHNGNPSSVRHFSCDLSGAYVQGIREHFLHAAVTADRFHLVNLVNDAVDVVRRRAEERQGAETDPFPLAEEPGDPERQGTNPSEGSAGFPAYAGMGRPNALKESFRDLFSMRPKETEVNLKQWLHWASHSRLSPMVKLARTFREQKSAILRWFSTRLSNGLLEGLNSLFQAARAKARG